MTWRFVVPTTAIACLLVGCTSQDFEPAEQVSCERVRDRLIELELRPDDANRTSHADVMRRAMGAQFLTTCMKTLDQPQMQCVVNAGDSKTAQGCMATAGAPPSAEPSRAEVSR